MTKTFEIRIDDTNIVRSTDGKQLQLLKLIHTDLNAPVLKTHGWIMSLNDLRSRLISRGILLPWQAQKHDDAEKLIRTRLDPFQQQHIAQRSVPMLLTFGEGDFTLQWYPMTPSGGGGDWTLKNLTHTIARLPGGHEDVGYFPNMFSALWKVVERKLFARGEAIAYADLSRIVFELADNLTADLKAVR